MRIRRTKQQIALEERYAREGFPLPKAAPTKGEAAYDPRQDGFNYGPGWGASPKPENYRIACALAYTLNAQARAIQAKAFALQEAARDVRLASNDAEKARALAALDAILAAYVPEAY